ncbi:MAG: ATP-binding cassette domain-containing protein [Tepidisphaerales bacterium]
MAEALLEASGIHVRFGEIEALRGVSLALSPASLMGLIGPNGAGKTTLLRVLAGLQPPDSGEVRLDGAPLTPDRRHLLGFTPDTPALWEDLTVRQFLHAVGLGYRLDDSEIRDRTELWLSKLWLTEKAGQKVRTLSRGMRQRLGIARTLLANPAVVLLDEPAAGLDPAGRVQFRQLLIDLREQGKALVVSSHILADMPEYCSHIGIMQAGRLVRFGTVAEVAGAGPDAGRRRRYRLRLSRPVARLEQTLLAIEGVSAVEVERDRATLEFDADDEASHRLLRRLLDDGVPVCEFAALVVNLEELYLRSGLGQVD